MHAARSFGTRIAILTIAILSVSGCAWNVKTASPERSNYVSELGREASKGPANSTAGNPLRGAALLIVCRENESRPLWVADTVYLDGHEVGRLKDDSYAAVRLPPGRYELSTVGAALESGADVVLRPNQVLFMERGTALSFSRDDCSSLQLASYVAFNSRSELDAEPKFDKTSYDRQQDVLSGVSGVARLFFWFSRFVS